MHHFWPMPEGCLSFGIMSTRGACADQLQTQVVHAVLPRIPNAVCVLAPSNYLTASRTVEETGASFFQHLAIICSRWQKVNLCHLYWTVFHLSVWIKWHLEGNIICSEPPFLLFRCLLWTCPPLLTGSTRSSCGRSFTVCQRALVCLFFKKNVLKWVYVYNGWWFSVKKCNVER